MASIEEIVTKLKELSPEQVEEVARVINRFSPADRLDPHTANRDSTVVLDAAIQHGWPAHLFEDLIGSLPDIERPAQPPAEGRPGL